MTARHHTKTILSVALLVYALSAWQTTTLGSESAKQEYLADAFRERILSARQQWGQLGLNTAVKPPQRDARPLQIGDRQYDHGLGMHAAGEVVVDLAGECASFEAEVGVQWQGGKSAASVVFQVFVDGEKRFDSDVMQETDSPRTVSVSLTDAEQLRLVVTDAGDGINSDVAVWANARMTRDPQAKQRRARTSVDVAQFAQVVRSDPNRMQGTQASRVEEFPAADLSLTEELAAMPDGRFTVAADEKGVGCIGLKWHEFRYLREVGLRFADPKTVPKGIKLQYWVGRSSWQGEWKTIDATVTDDQRGRTWRLPYQDRNKPTDKVRWIFPATSKPIVVERLSAYTSSVWKTAALRLESESPSSTPVSIELYNGQFTEPSEGSSPKRCTWDPAEPLRVTVRYALTRECKTDQTVLRFQMAGQVFAVAVEDVLTNEAVYVPQAGLFVTRDPAPIALTAFREKIAGRKTLLEQVEQLPEQTFPHALEAVHCPIQDQGPTMLSLACDQRKFVARRDGSVDFNTVDQPSATFDGTTRRGKRQWQYRLQAEFGDGNNEKLNRRLDGGWLPMPVTSVDQNGVVYRTRTFVAPLDDEPPASAPDWLRDRAVCVVEYTAENTRPVAAEALLVLTLLNQTDKQQHVAPRAVNDGIVVSADDRLLVFIDTSHTGPLATSSDAAATFLSGTLPPGGKARAVAYIPANKTRPESYTALKDQAQPLAEKTKRYWQTLMAKAAQINLPDELLTNVIRASQVHIMLAAGNEENGSRVDVWTSADRYGSLESESQPIIRGMDMMGQQDFARRGLDFFIARYNKSGFLTTGYTMMGSGWHLWTLAEYVDRWQDQKWLQSVAPEVARLCHWIVEQRQKTKCTDIHGQKTPNYGLTPPGVIADWARFTNTTFQAAHYCAGLREAARVLAEIDHPDAEALANDATAYRDDILRAYRWTQARSPVVPRGDGTWVTAQPPIFFIFGEVGGFFPGEDGSRAWCKNAMAHHLMVNRLIDPKAEETTWMLDIMEGIEFLRSGLFEPDYNAEMNQRLWFDLGGFNKCQPYYRRSVELYAMRDQVKPFIRGYFNTLPSLLNLENLTLWEHFHNRGGWNKTHETGWFLCQTRIMLLQERNDQLWLAPFVTRNWLKDGMTVNVQNAPTIFGKTSYRIDSDVEHGVIEAVIDPPTARPPSKIVLRLRHPEEKPIQSVTVNGSSHNDFDPKAEIVTLSPGNEELSVRVQY